jgi:hypothetical protein
LALGPVITVDTTRPVDIQAVAAEVWRLVRSGEPAVSNGEPAVSNGEPAVSNGEPAVSLGG